MQAQNLELCHFPKAARLPFRTGAPSPRNACYETKSSTKMTRYPFSAIIFDIVITFSM